jgi:hypothetical protein
VSLIVDEGSGEENEYRRRGAGEFTLAVVAGDPALGRKRSLVAASKPSTRDQERSQIIVSTTTEDR